MNFEDSKDPKLKEKLRNVSSPEELLELAKKEGFDLSDEQLEGVSGGDSWACWDIKGCTDVCARYNA
ncbi:MAG: Nif11 family protein [Atopobiaceae bacterium]|nr:Nif11 family protein [Atopobiaceae bacterium]